MHIKSFLFQVPSCSDENDELEETPFYQELPILELFCTPHHIQSCVPYDVDSDVQLVCKYLKACQTRLLGRMRIDKLHMDGFDEVKFSTDQDLPEEECHLLLKQYMPPHIANIKITQRLFVRYTSKHWYKHDLEVS